jgi:hypothetical protein
LLLAPSLRQPPLLLLLLLACPCVSPSWRAQEAASDLQAASHLLLLLQQGVLHPQQKAVLTLAAAAAAFHPRLNHGHCVLPLSLLLVVLLPCCPLACCQFACLLGTSCWLLLLLLLPPLGRGLPGQKPLMHAPPHLLWVVDTVSRTGDTAKQRLKACEM